MSAQYRLRYMQLEDIPTVLEIDKLSFPTPWSSRSYFFEITDNKNSHMVVIDALPPAPPKNGDLLHRIFDRLNPQSVPPPVQVGYGGFWFITGEAHISTIAVHPDHRGEGLGEVLLAGMMGRAIDMKAEYAVLEVRVSNKSAMSLYEKYEFEEVGRRKGYYRDNNEDAFLMHCSPLDAAYRARFANRVTKLWNRVDYENLLTAENAARLGK